MRGGKQVADLDVGQTNPAELARYIVGDDESGLSLVVTATQGSAPARAVNAEAPSALAIRGLSIKDSRNHEALKQIDLSVSSGEVVGVAGVDGNGQRELLQAILGLLPPSTGSVAMNGKDQRGVSTSERLKNGLRIVPEERHYEAIVETWSLDENAALGLQRLPYLNKRGMIDLKARKELSSRVAARFNTKHGGFNLPLASLSGGNQQRFVAARALELNPNLLVAFQPARGLDLGGTFAVYKAIRRECERGMGALIISFDLDELLLHCDRIVVLNAGRLAEAQVKDRTTIGRLMVGAA
jgi:ABC-type uncharacterized transport system ATPase subunit